MDLYDVSKKAGVNPPVTLLAKREVSFLPLYVTMALRNRHQVNPPLGRKKLTAL